ncbi:hypothetical protein CK203_087448 [Vitis vinifera]|uniref:Uncharacterized protein n=1 Tax=Vitis vinifera TaxID=29760 RepID=A0A438ENH3_VITVI|nr:hypothetical protein CK203_087448 [Vitis vinifera]
MSDDPARDYLPLPFDEFGSRVVIRMMQSLDHLLGLGLEIDSSIPKVILPFGSQPVVPKVFIIPIIETIDVGLSIGQDVSFDVMLRFVSRIYDDVPTVSSMNMSCFEYFPMCYDYSKTLSCYSSHGAKPVDEDFETIDYGTKVWHQELQISTSLSIDERVDLIHLLRVYLDVFAWSYGDMPGLDPSIVQHHLPILPYAKSVKQKLRRLPSCWSLQVKEEIQK